MALPVTETPNMADDKQLRALTCDPKFRRVLVTDGRTELGQATAKALADAGASTIFVGVAEAWRPYPGADALAAVPGVEILPLDLTDTVSVSELAGEIGGKTDILVNTAEYVRPRHGDGGQRCDHRAQRNGDQLFRTVAPHPGLRARHARPAAPTAKTAPAPG